MARVVDKGNPLSTREFASDAARHVAVVPSDTVDLPQMAAGIYIGGAGNITILDRDGVSRLISGLPAGSTLKTSVKRVMATGTTATLMNAVY